MWMWHTIQVCPSNTTTCTASSLLVTFHYFKEMEHVYSSLIIFDAYWLTSFSEHFSTRVDTLSEWWVVMISFSYRWSTIMVAFANCHWYCFYLAIISSWLAWTVQSYLCIRADIHEQILCKVAGSKWSNSLFAKHILKDCWSLEMLL